jgi:predicted DNA-binding transcriptional regulator AlpA
MEQVKRYLRTPQAADYLQVSKSYLEKLRVAGGGPEYISAGRVVLYDAASIDAWAAARRRASTSEAVARKPSHGGGK